MQDKLLVGTVLKPQGIRGEIKIKFYTDSADSIKACKRLYIDGEEKKIVSYRFDGEAIYLGLYGVADRNAAERLRGKDLYADRADVPELEEGSYYIVDLLGCKVVTDGGKEIGILKNITPAATDVYTVTAGEKEILFPAVGDVFVRIDPEEKLIILNEERFNEIAVL